MQRLAWLAFSLVATPCGAQDAALPHRVTGTVFVDADGDGTRDPDERGLEGAKLSNGRELAITDREGRYALTLRPGDTLFLVKPPGHAIGRRANGLPDTWAHHVPHGSPPLRFGGIAAVAAKGRDFALREAADAGALDVLVFGDPQPKSARHVEHFRRDIVEPLRAAPAATLGLSLGDIVDDDLSLYPGVIAATTRLGLPWLHAPGNHDLDLDATRDEDSLLSFRAAFGPDTFAWEETQASFVVLDDVVFHANEGNFTGGLRESQFAFLAAYLDTLPRAKRLVIAAHVPFHDAVPGRESFRRADRERLFALLAPFPNVLLLTSHAHAQRHWFHDADDGWHGAQPLHEYVVGAACGGFWSGVEDAAGLPDARMSDGTPNGYARLRIEGADYRLRWHAARDPQDTRIALWAPKVLRRGSYPAFAVTANVFMGMDDTRVEFRVDDGAWKPMSKSTRPDPALLALNADDDRAGALRAFDRFVEAGSSTHLWRAPLPTDLAAGEHLIEVRAFDRWDGELRAQTTYALQEAPAP